MKTLYNLLLGSIPLVIGCAAQKGVEEQIKSELISPKSRPLYQGNKLKSDFVIPYRFTIIDLSPGFSCVDYRVSYYKVGQFVTGIESDISDTTSRPASRPSNIESIIEPKKD